MFEFALLGIAAALFGGNHMSNKAASEKALSQYHLQQAENKRFGLGNACNLAFEEMYCHRYSYDALVDAVLKAHPGYYTFVSAGCPFDITLDEMWELSRRLVSRTSMTPDEFSVWYVNKMVTMDDLVWMPEFYHGKSYLTVETPKGFEKFFPTKYVAIECDMKKARQLIRCKDFKMISCVVEEFAQQYIDEFVSTKNQIEKDYLYTFITSPRPIEELCETYDYDDVMTNFFGTYQWENWRANHRVAEYIREL